MRYTAHGLIIGATWFALALPAQANRADCFPLSQTVRHLPSSDAVHHGTPSLAARPGDILNYLEELPAPQRAQFRELITAARTQNPPIRGLETYERVLFTAVRTRSKREALLNTLIPIAQGPENVVAEMIRHLEAHPPCHAWSICGIRGSQLFTRIIRRHFDSATLLPALRGTSENSAVGLQSAAEQSALLQRLRAIQQAGEWRYEDMIRLSVEYARLNRLNFDVRQLLRDHFRGHSATPARWSSFLTDLNNEVGNTPATRELLVATLLDTERLQRAVITVSSRPFGEIEIAPPGFMVTPLEITSSPTFADERPMLAQENMRHDGNHRKDMIDQIDRPLHNLSFQLARYREWRPFEQLEAELRTRNPKLGRLINRFAFQVWHEFGQSINFVELYLHDSIQNQGIARYIERDPRWASEVVASFRRDLTSQIRSSNIASLKTRIELAEIYFRPLMEEVKRDGMTHQEHWNAFVSHLSSPAARVRPLQRRLIEMFIARVAR